MSSNTIVVDDVFNLIKWVKQRLKQFATLTLLQNYQDKWDAACKMWEPCLPTLMRSGHIEPCFSPPLKENECSIIICNHVSDLDWAILFGFSNPHTMTTLNNSTGKNPTETNALVAKTYAPFKPTAFTHDHFGKVPVIGPVVSELLIGVYKGMTEQALIQVIQERLQQGYNLFVLFPEGGIYDQSKVEGNHKYWLENVKSIDRYEYKEVLYPRFTAYQALVKALNTRLTYIIDVTLKYPNHKPWETAFDYKNYPSIVHATSSKLGNVRCHSKIIVVNKQKQKRWQQVLSPRWFIDKIWKRKDRLLRTWRKIDENLQQIPLDAQTTDMIPRTIPAPISAHKRAQSEIKQMRRNNSDKQQQQSNPKLKKTRVKIEETNALSL